MTPHNGPATPLLPGFAHPRSVRAAAALLRLSLGATMLAHSLVLKLMVFGMAGTVGYFVKTGYPAALAYVVTFGEIAAGLALILGVAVRWASLGLIPILAGATFTVAPNGWVFDAPGGGWEFPAFLVVAAIVQALLGKGAAERTEGERP